MCYLLEVEVYNHGIPFTWKLTKSEKAFVAMLLFPAKCS